MPSNKINRILAVILVVCLTIVLRAWHLGVIQREEKLIEAQKPQSKTILQRANRGTICDRFQIPLALNRISYNAAVYYAEIVQIPALRWIKDGEGKPIRSWPRKEYIGALSKMLAAELDLDPERIEDLIYSKASLFPHVPYVLKAGLTEEEHYRLKGLERDWPGIHAETAAERFYPLGKTACHLIGTMGAISRNKYRDIADELSVLEQAIDLYEQEQAVELPKGYSSFEEIFCRRRELREKAYTLNDLVGKSGIEGQFEEELRGFYGKKTFEVDQKGRFVRELPGGKDPVSGRQIVLSISAELQQFAEELLAKSEKDREGRSFGIDPIDKKRKALKQPWIKGGAIVAFDPNNGEMLAMASFPRFDPNDFIPSMRSRSAKQARLCRWLENERYVASVWDGGSLLSRERFGRRFTEEEIPLTWEFYLELILPKEGPLPAFFLKVDDVKGAIQIQEDFEIVRYASHLSDPTAVLDLLFSPHPQHSVDAETAKASKRLHGCLQSIPSRNDQLFVIDLCRVAVDSARFSDELISKIGPMKLSAYRALCQIFLKLENEAKETERKIFHQTKFRAWREIHQKSFLAEKRRLEKERKTYARPYIDYLDQKEKELFAMHWNEKRLFILRNRIEEVPQLAAAARGLSPELTEEFLRTFRSFQQLDRSLLGKYNKHRIEKDLAGSFIPKGGGGFLRSHAFQVGAPLGSLFKLVGAYEGLRQDRFPVLIDDQSRDPKAVAYSLSGAPYPRIYKGGRLPRSSIQQVGKIDVVGALEQSSNPYFSILSGDFLSDAEDLKVAAQWMGYGEKSGIDLPGEAKGNLPTDLRTNRTGLYSFAIGQHTLLATPLQAAVALGAIANGGMILKPKISLASAGLIPDRKTHSVFSLENGFAKRELQMLGIPFSLFTAVQAKNPISKIDKPVTEIRRKIPMNPSIRGPLLEGMDRVVWSQKGNARSTIIRSLRMNPELTADYLSLQHQMIGKTSTAEILFSPNVNPSSLPYMAKHIWFGSIAFSPDFPAKVRYDHPELVVVVLLRYGDAGREAAPIAAQMIRKWREIKQKHG